jgi:thiamine biosynthesis lipoprotein ApbE
MRFTPILVAAFALAGVPGSAVPARTGRVVSSSWHHDGILGTSADFTFVAASSASAARAERVALAEIERLRRVLSSWDDSSELARLFAVGALEHPSADLLTVLDRYTVWNARSAGAYSARVGELTTLWRAAAATGTEPAVGEIARVVRDVAAPAWRVDGSRLVALTAHRVDLNSLGKGYIIDRALRAVRDSVRDLRGALINIGGDIHVWGAAPTGGPWSVAVADPARHADNARPLTRLEVTDGAVSSSGDYERGITIGARRYSHIFDPRSGRPVDHLTGVTVIAPENATANALATSLSVLTPDEGLALVRSLPGVEAMLVSADGTVRRSPGFARYERPVAPPSAAAAVITAKLAIDVTPTVANRHQPFVAVWITDTLGKHLRTVAFWGDKPKFLHEMSKWWGLNRNDQPLIDAVTRATRPAGKYTLEWDGLDQKGNPVAASTYTFWLEVGFEDGAHSAKSVTLTCGRAPTTGQIPTAAAFTGAEISCEPAKK